ncbi:LacI family transcriptional regulator [Paenibacillus hemerocallicola]|uniref:LacI family transcriptional regulator n=1 Tax=Paenibacillus hemerocallicola TaxID=1172614 RepID=A0A5C4TC18_9BACL|nr:LacI family DNA-binding transcriptional regulator [Paenibacillus hemerocallicola]TNJ66146.1 LacI family transcriptional regulator [Paenibacillus hemerocallicola]
MPTLQDIANIAQCSKATVSLALSNHPRIAESTKARIRKVAIELGYLPAEPDNDVASKPAASRRSIGVLYIGEDAQKSIGQGFFRETLLSIIQEASRSNCNVVMIEVNASNGQITEDELCEKIYNSGVEGAVVICFRKELHGFNTLIDQQFPLVFVGDHTIADRDVKLHTVMTNNHDGGREATEYLLGLGHSRIALVTSPTSTERINGYFSAMRTAGHNVSDKHMMIVSPPYEKNDGRLRMLGEQEFTAIFATSSLAGLMVLQHLRFLGKQIPDDISMIVFDDSESFQIESPPITVMKQDLESLGTYAVKMLLDVVGEVLPLPGRVAISGRLIERASCRSLHAPLKVNR